MTKDEIEQKHLDQEQSDISSGPEQFVTGYGRHS